MELDRKWTEWTDKKWVKLHWHILLTQQKHVKHMKTSYVSLLLFFYIGVRGYLRPLGGILSLVWKQVDYKL